MPTNFGKFKTWAARALVLGLVGGVLGGVAGMAWGIVEGRSRERARLDSIPRLEDDVKRAEAEVNTAEAELQAIVQERARLASEAKRHVQPAVGPDNIQFYTLRGSDLSRQSELMGEKEIPARLTLARARDDARSSRTRLQEAQEPADSEVWVFGLALAICGAGVLAALPAALGAWFLFLHMLGQVSSAARGKDGAEG